MFTFLLIIFIIDIVLLIPVILMQAGSGAQSGIFGGDITLGAFGAKTSEVLVKFTVWLVAIFFVLALLLNYIKVRELKMEPISIQNVLPSQVNAQPQTQEEDNSLAPLQKEEKSGTDTEDSLKLPVTPTE